VPVERVRLDEMLLRLELARSKNQARGFIMAGLVTVDGKMVDKAGTSVRIDSSVAVKPTSRFVSRGGQKLAGALESFALSVRDKSALDVGASTGGFVDCLLQSGASQVIALDVGRGQLDAKLRADARVHVIEGVNARFLSAEQLPFRANLLTMDVSFISVTKVLPAVVASLDNVFDGLILVKPQFEAGPKEVGRKGVVRDESIHKRVLLQIATFVAGGLGLEVLGACRSGLPGVAGNLEFFLHIGRGREKAVRLDRLEKLVEECVR